MQKWGKNKRQDIPALARALLHYDVISFDIFDTLILRPFKKPEDLFLTLSPKYNMPNFKKIRMDSEKKVRDHNSLLTGYREASIYDIYKEINNSTGIDIEEGVNSELEAEIQFCYPNPYFKKVYDILVQNKKKIIIISNMYLPRELMTKLLKSCGYNNYHELFISCDYNKNKTDGSLFDIARKKIGEKAKVIHIGDNLKTDIEGAELAKWDSYYYIPNRDITEDLKKLDISELIGSFYYGIVNNFFNNGINDSYPYKDPQYYIGFTYGGPLILGFVNFIHKYALENNIDKIFFVSRDGYILQKVYDFLYNDIPSKYIYWSRQASIKSNIKKSFNNFFNHFFKRRKKRDPQTTIQDILVDMKLTGLSENLANYNLDIKDPIGEKNVEINFLNLLLDNISTIEDTYQRFYNATKLYLQENFKNLENYCIIDIGWRASGGLSIKDFLNKELNIDCNITNIVAGNYPRGTTYDTSFINTKDIISYMFSDIKNTDLAFQHKENIIFNNFVAELLTAAPHPSFLYFDLNEKNTSYNFVFDQPETENYDTINLIHQGELDFIKEYLKLSAKHQYLRDIPGRDVSKILLSLADKRHYNKVRNLFKDFTYPKYVGGVYDKEQTLIETFGDICPKRK